LWEDAHDQPLTDDEHKDMVQKRGNWPGSVYRQQQRFFYDHNDDRCPRVAFLQDLAKETKKWIAAGDQVILMMDANGDVRDPEIARLVREVLLHNQFANDANVPSIPLI
jgi:uncharacterized protein YecE (DUF72 family)